MSRRRSTRFAEELAEETRGFRVPGIAIALVLLIVVIAVLIYFGPRLQEAKAEEETAAQEATEVDAAEDAAREAADPFAGVPDEAPARPKDTSPFTGLATLEEEPSWVAAVEAVAKAKELEPETYRSLEVLGAGPLKAKGYALRLPYLQALEKTESLVPFLEKLQAESGDARAMLLQRQKWQEKVKALDRDFGLVPRG